MKKIVTCLALSLAFSFTPAFAHHPAEDMVDADIYEMIDDMVSDTMHVVMVTDDMSETTITADSVSAAEDLIDDGLLATLSLLGDEDDDTDDVTVTISFGDYVEPYDESADLDLSSSSSDDDDDDDDDSDDDENENRWSERNDWGREVIFTVNTVIEVDDEDDDDDDDDGSTSSSRGRM
jgi:hypothetical protein